MQWMRSNSKQASKQTSDSGKKDNGKAKRLVCHLLAVCTSLSAAAGTCSLLLSL
jgi:hypothetical protein